MKATSQVRSSGTISSSLLVGIRSFRADAWRRLVHIYGPLVFYWCQKAGLGRQDAEDLGQEVFRAVAARINGFERKQPGDTFGGWLRTITRHKVADHWRRKSRQPNTIESSELLQTLGDDSHDSLANEPSDRDQIHGIVYQRALELIRTEFREPSWKAFWATAVEGRPTADIAKDLSMTQMAVRKAKSRVLRRLREEFDGLGEVDE
jgi:RNA polymerase sigma-70 factor (ECF subfamily)